ncbi:TetR/AcrR family transcriptional regulator [Nocardia rhamnosiphila]|uniref:TetR/AcrR family transcriptional regulator n=1 Tax=Nocardia rhamnosiphila TaxID=426716 RepID=UPI0006903688|nr:TetR/AcrR family transcriptional regulator [Nocardia rhamnosiphila]
MDGKHGRVVSRRDQIKRVAAGLFVERGVAGTSVRDIAEGVGMLSGSLYHHFPSKDAIAFAILDDFLTDLNARYRSVLPHVNGMREELRALVYSSIEIAEAHPYATEIYQNEKAYHGPGAPAEIAHAVREAHTFWIDAATRASTCGELRAGLDPVEFARMLREGVWWSIRYHREHLSQRRDEVTDTVVAAFVDGGAAPEIRAPGAPAGDAAAITDRLDRIEHRLEDLSKRLVDEP